MAGEGASILNSAKPAKAWIEPAAPKEYVSIGRAVLMERLAELFQSLAEDSELSEALKESVGGLLSEEGDEVLRDEIFAQISRFFSVAGSLDRSERTGFCLQVVRTVLAQRPRASALKLSIHGRIVRELARLDDLPWHLRPLCPTSIHAPAVPEPVLAGDFEHLLPAAIERRIRSILGFFHRRNPDIRREMPIPYLLTPEFCDRLVEAVTTLMVPAFLQDRKIRFLASTERWEEVDTAKFWEVLQRTGEHDRILKSWATAWSSLLPDPAAARRKGVEPPVPPLLSALRRKLGTEEFGPLEISLCASLLGPAFSRADLEKAWTRARQLYEQEMDRRHYQDKAREGALRDNLLGLLDDLPDRNGELMVMLSYWAFPRMSIRFLAAFSRNKGTEADRRLRVPFLMRFLDNPAAVAMMKVEDGRMDEEKKAIEASQEEERERRKREAPGGAVRWDVHAAPKPASGGAS